MPAPVNFAQRMLCREECFKDGELANSRGHFVLYRFGAFGVSRDCFRGERKGIRSRPKAAMLTMATTTLHPMKKSHPASKRYESLKSINHPPVGARGVWCGLLLARFDVA